MGKIWQLVVGEFRGDRIIYGLIVLYLAVANAILVPAGHVFPSLYVDYFASLVMLDIVALPALFAIGLSLRSIVADPRHPTAWLRSCLNRQRIARVLAGFGLLLALVPFMATFTAMKSFIGLNGFAVDKSLADFDRWLHFGVDPVIYLHTLINYADVWHVVAFFYGPGWMLWVNGFVLWMAVATSNSEMRQRFFIGYIFAWAVLGNFVAWLAISAGPAYFAEVTGDATRFASALATVGANVLPNGSGIRDVQLYLWELYTTRTAGFGMGISAFPSMHLAMVVLCALAAFELNRFLAVAGVIIVLIIEMGSVLFGWHYAIDGYFSIIVMTAFWWAIRRARADSLDIRNTESATDMAVSGRTASHI